ncbi:hypothetical protein Tco_1142037 [Tanacetum coccineum]
MEERRRFEQEEAKKRMFKANPILKELWLLDYLDNLLHLLVLSVIGVLMHLFTRRNKLTTSRAQDLVFIHNNLRLLSRNPNDDEKMWDVGGDAFDSMEDVGFLEFADLLLDEPEFENDFIIDN